MKIQNIQVNQIFKVSSMYLTMLILSMCGFSVD